MTSTEFCIWQLKRGTGNPRQDAMRIALGMPNCNLVKRCFFIKQEFVILLKN